MASHSRTLFRTLWFEEQPNDIARQLDIFYIFSLKITSKLLLSSAENTITRKDYFSFLV
jgi:hypothetical protein